MVFPPTDDASIRTLDDRRARANVLDLDGETPGLRTFWLEAAASAHTFFR